LFASRIKSAAFSAIMTTGALVFAEVISSALAAASAEPD
jgi:hypothetical protein